MYSCNCKHGSDHLLALPHPLWSERRRRDAHKRWLRLARDRLTQQRLSRARWPEKHDTLGRCSNSFEDIWAKHGPDYNFVDCFLFLLKACDVVPSEFAVFLHVLRQNCLHHLRVKIGIPLILLLFWLLLWLINCCHFNISLSSRSWLPSMYHTVSYNWKILLHKWTWFFFL